MTVHRTGTREEWFVARLAPLPKLQAFKERMGWAFPRASSAGRDVNTDSGVWCTEAQQRDGGMAYPKG